MSPGQDRTLSCLLLLSRFSDCKYVPPRLVSHRSDTRDRVLSSEPQEQGMRLGNFLVVPGVRLLCWYRHGVGLGFDNAVSWHRQPQARDLSWAVPGRATESFTCTKSFKCSHFLKENMQW